MKFRSFGRTGFNVSDVGYGLWGMSGWPGSDDNQSRHSLQLACDLGCNFYDTAWAYGEGKSDKFLGELLQANLGKRLYSASKVPPKGRKWPARRGDRYSDLFPADYVFQQADMIRSALGVDTIDLLQFHVWHDDWADLKEFRETVERLKKEKIVTAFGISLNRWEPKNGIRAIRTGLVDAVQVVYNLFDQNPEDELFPICRELNVGVIARVPLDEGSLGGKITRDTQFAPKEWRSTYFTPENLAKTMDRVDAIKQDLPSGMNLAELAIRFVLSEPTVSTLIIGMRKPEHVRQNLAYSDKGPLDPELVKKLRRHRWVRHPANGPA